MQRISKDVTSPRITAEICSSGTYFLRCSAKELLLVWANMSKSSWLRHDREDKVPLTLSEATSGWEEK